MKLIYHPFLLLLLLPTLGYAQSSKIASPELVFVDGGEFYMGCTVEQNQQCVGDEKPAVHVSLFDFWIGKYEVTNTQYAEFLSHSGNQVEGDDQWYKTDQYSLINETGSDLFQPKKGFENYPVTNVSWYGAKAYTDWLSKQTNKYYRLPTEAEWEYAARGGQESNGYIFSGGNTPEEVAWNYLYAAESKTGWEFKDDVGAHPVGQKLPNELGIYDLSGNIKEWCEDIYNNVYAGGNNPAGPESGSLRVLRGGSWDNKDMDSRVSARSRAEHVNRFSVNKGFRVVMEKDISSQLDSLATENSFNGTILVKKKDKTIYHKSFGIADREENTPIVNDTQFAIASITKLFTSVIILQLVEEGEIDLDKNISDYVPEYEGPAGDKVSIHHLLTHTSGIQNCEEIQSEGNHIPDVYLDEISTDELLHKYCSGDQITTPGSAFNYNNGDYIILGKIIEKVTNISYQEALEQRILKPLKLEHSGLITMSNTIENLAQGYKWNKEISSFENDPEKLLQNYYSSGAMYSTTEDLAKFSQALFYRKTLLSEESIRLLIQTYPESRSYGYGVWSRYSQYNNTVVNVIQRFGRIWGVNTLISHFIGHDITIIVLANTDKVSVSRFQSIVGEQIFD